MRCLLDKPQVWGLLYLAVVPAFAFVYTGLHYGFTQSTLDKEPHTLELTARRFSAALEMPLATALDRAGDVIVQEIHVDILGRSEAGFEAIISTCSHSTSDVGCDFDDQIVFDGGTEVSLQKLSSPSGSLLRIVPSDMSQETRFRSLVRSIGADRPPIVYQDPQEPQTSYLFARDDPPQIDLRGFSPLLRKYSTLEAAYGGNPAAPGQGYWRMLYFSVVTITTVGFGDIVPTTQTARLVVALEAILGVVLIGLFLNAIGRRVANHGR